MEASRLPIAKPSTCTNNLPLNVNVLSLRQNSRARLISRYLKLAYLRFGTYELRFFTRYVDDILVALKDENTANSFKLYLETLRPNIRFKIEYELFDKIKLVSSKAYYIDHIINM